MVPWKVRSRRWDVTSRMAPTSMTDWLLNNLSCRPAVIHQTPAILSHPHPGFKIVKKARRQFSDGQLQISDREDYTEKIMRAQNFNVTPKLSIMRGFPQTLYFWKKNVRQRKIFRQAKIWGGQLPPPSLQRHSTAASILQRLETKTQPNSKALLTGINMKYYKVCSRRGLRGRLIN